MKESVFTTEVLGSLRDLNAWAYKIADAPITRGVLAVTRFTAAKPCDILACIEGSLVAIETKQIRKWKAFSINDMRPAQIIQLTRIAEHDGRSFVFLNVRVPRTPSRLIAFEWTALHARWAKHGSIKAEELKRLPFTPAHKQEDGKIRYDLSQWAGDFMLTFPPGV